MVGPIPAAPELLGRFRVAVDKPGREDSFPHRVLMSLSHPPPTGTALMPWSKFPAFLDKPGKNPALLCPGSEEASFMP